MGEERRECLCFMSPPCSLGTGQLQGAEGLLLPGALVGLLPGSHRREGYWWEALSFAFPTKISCT